MKKYFPSLMILFSAGLIALGCNSVLYAQGDYGNYDNGYDNNNNYDNNGYDNNADNSYDYNNDNYDQYGNDGEAQITFNDFYSQLAPYGRWVVDPSYGRVWIANVPNFQPYSTS